PSTAPVVEPANPGVPEEPVDETPEQEEPASADPTSSSPTSSAAEEPAHSEDSSSTSTSTSPTSSTSEQPAEPESKDHIEATPQDSTSDSISFDAARKVQFYGANAVILASANQARSGHVAKLTSVDGIERYLEVDSVRTADNGNILVTFKQPNGANYAAGENTVQPGAVLELDSSGAVVDNITRHADYNASKSAVYENLRRLGPWVDIARVVANGNAVSSPSLASSQVNAVLPLDQAGARVLVMDEAGAKSVKSVKIAFDDAAPVVYPARFAGATGEIANFDVDVDGTTVRYQYSGVYLKNGLAAYAAVISRAKGLNSSQVLNSWDSAADKALLKENFEGINGHEGFRSARLERMLSAMIASQPQCVALEGVSVMGAMRECGFLNSKLTDTVQHLNWLDRAFDFDMGGTRMADWLAASSNVDRLGPAPDANTIIERSTHYKVRYRDTDGKTKRKMAYHLGSLQYAGYRLRYIYEDIVPGGNGRTIMEHLISHYTKFNTDYDAWLKASFEGLIIEPKVGMQVSTWDHLARFTYDMRDERYEEGMSIPAFMTTHAQKMYMAVLPGYIIFGNGDAYSEPANRDQRVITWEQLPGELQAFVDKLAGWLENINGVIPGFSERLEKKLYRVWDAPHNGVRSYYQDTNDAMLHRFGWLYSGRISDVAFENNYAAYRVDDFVFFGNSAFLFNYATITHEFTHLMDGGPMFNDKGRRTGGGNTEIGAESFAAGMFEQSFGMGNMAPNWTGSGFGGWDAISNNEPSRVNTPAGFQSYYAGLFDVLYTLEYAMGQAFLKLDTNSQKKLAMTTEPIGGGGGAAGRVTGYYGYNGRADLKDMEDLWDNRVVIRPAIPRNDSLGWNDYGAVGSIDTMWYVPNNDEGFSDSQSFKLQAFMMAAANGWDGMSAVVSGRKTDPQAITEATNGKYTSWKQFKLDQWDRVAREMPAEQMKALIDACEKALRSDAQRGGYTSNNALRNKILLGVKKQTNDFESSYTTVDYKTLLE
ncbi:MAG: ZmpA/ZmpB/ZmpC family metallo-endopeptidase, partial [Corynebacterium sp.]|nr:ZmpA/ZmpB/ZmpC family metallo-endopeptidase [Corynebacterium sp.]